MKKYIEYILPLLSLIALFVGILGKSIDENLTGIEKITLLGWLCIIIGFGIFIFTSIKVFLDNKEQSKKEHLKNVAHIRFRDELYGHFIWPFSMLYWKWLDAGFDFHLRSYSFYDKLVPALKKIERKPVGDNYLSSPNETWCKLFKNFAKDGEVEIDKLLSNYSEIVNPLLVIEIEKIKTHIFLRRIKTLTENYAPIDEYAFYLIHPEMHEVIEYLTFLNNCLQIIRIELGDKIDDEFDWHDKRMYKIKTDKNKIYKQQN
jgi:hypothetical protein